MKIILRKLYSFNNSGIGSVALRDTGTAELIVNHLYAKKCDFQMKRSRSRILIKLYA
jgi:hypothetical protein